MTKRSTQRRKNANTKGDRAARRGTVTPVALDRFDLYELCVQSPTYDARVLDAIHAGKPRVLGEDFCGTAALCRAWVDLDSNRRAVAVDHDPVVIERALAANTQRDPGDPRRKDKPRTRIDYLLADVRDADDPGDVLALLNYAICEIHTRAALVEYLAHARRRLRRKGCLICDIYTGNDAFLPGETARTFDHPSGQSVLYTWDQREADPLTGLVENSIHFEIRARPAKPRIKSRRSPATPPVIIRDAFVYRWRLWSIPELRDAMTEAGFHATQVYPRSAEAITNDDRFIVEPLANPDELPDSFSCYVVGRL